MSKLLFPAIQAECLIVLRKPDDILNVTVAFNDRDVNLDAFFGLAMWQLLEQAKAAGRDPQAVIEYAIRKAGII